MKRWPTSPTRRRSRSPKPRSLPPGVTLTQGLRIELTAYENNTQVDSTSLDVQIVDDPSEQQNPMPDHDLLRRIADRVRRSGLERIEGPDDDDRAAAADRRAFRGQADAGLERLVAVVAPDRLAYDRMGLATACRAGMRIGLSPFFALGVQSR